MRRGLRTKSPTSRDLGRTGAALGAAAVTAAGVAGPGGGPQQQQAGAVAGSGMYAAYRNRSGANLAPIIGSNAASSLQQPPDRRATQVTFVTPNTVPTWDGQKCARLTDPKNPSSLPPPVLKLLCFFFSGFPRMECGYAMDDDYYSTFHLSLKLQNSFWSFFFWTWYVKKISAQNSLTANWSTWSKVLNSPKT
jgi:hypothetical protein